MRPRRLRPPRTALVPLACLAVLVAGCAGAGDRETPAAEGPQDGATSPPPTGDPAAATDAADLAPEARTAAPTRPAWLGTRVLPRRPDGFGEVRPTPPELRDRRLPPPDDLPLPEPPADGSFRATIDDVPAEVVARATWKPACPVDLDDLRYLTVTFWGFDERPHTGEMIVHASAAEEITEVFRRLYEARFPIEEMRVIAEEELDAPPTGDGNVTTGFVCREMVTSARWSEHAFGLAVDINPFHNPYVRGDLVVPELASAYTDRDDVRPGMIVEGGVVTGAFAAIGWEWGGHWEHTKDWMHFSESGR